MNQAFDNSSDPIGSELVRDDASFVELVEQYLRGLSEHVRTMEAAVGSADFEALRRSAHQLKGSGGGYGYPLLSQFAADLERMAKAHSIDECLIGIERIKRLCARLVVDVRS